MNPVTRRLLDEIEDPDLAGMALAWDRLEEQIVGLYRDGVCSAEQAEEYERNRRSARQAIGRWEQDLEPCWKAVEVDGEPARDSPFQAILEVEDARKVPRNRNLIRGLPAAREALNHLLLERRGRSGSRKRGPGRN